MEGNGGAGGGSGSEAPPWDLAMHWAPSAAAGSSYPQPQPLALRPAGGVPSSQLELLHLHHQQRQQQQQQQQELTCLKLGKRPACCWAGAAAANQVVAVAQVGAGLPPAHHVHGNRGDAAGGGGASGTAAAEGKRKEKAAAPSAAAVPRCQVEGCHVALADAKDYHRRHKVCEAHSKAPRVIVLGAEQRFCQQCSRFHAISEFDDAKRSCRRRLAGHNERRRKSNASDAMARGIAHPHGVTAFGHHGFLPPCGGLPGTPAGALSLLSSARGGVASGSPWLVTSTTPDLSARSSAALDDLIAENRAALVAWQYFSASDRSSATPPGARHFASSSSAVPPPDQQAASNWGLQRPYIGVGGGRYHVAPPSAWHATLDLMQTTSTTAAPPATGGAPFRPVPERPAGATPRGKTKDEDAASGCSMDACAPAGGARVL